MRNKMTELVKTSSMFQPRLHIKKMTLLQTSRVPIIPFTLIHIGGIRFIMNSKSAGYYLILDVSSFGISGFPVFILPTLLCTILRTYWCGLP